MTSDDQMERARHIKQTE